MRIVLQALLISLTAMPMLTGSPAEAGNNETRQPTNDVATETAPQSNRLSGRVEYQKNCSVCHGPDGRGFGPISEAAGKPAADLTQISRRNNDCFPFSRVAAIIRDGGKVAGHEAQGLMPAWGTIFSDDSDPIRSRAVIFELTQYIESIQD